MEGPPPVTLGKGPSLVAGSFESPPRSPPRAPFLHLSQVLSVCVPTRLELCKAAAGHPVAPIAQGSTRCLHTICAPKYLPDG